MDWSIYTNDQDLKSRGYTIQTWAMIGTPDIGVDIGKILGDTNLNLMTDLNSYAAAYFYLEKSSSINFTLTTNDYYVSIGSLPDGDFTKVYENTFRYWSNYDREVITINFTLDLSAGYHFLGLGNDEKVEYLDATLEFKNKELFTDEAEIVDFSNLTGDQLSNINASSSLYDAKAGNDNVKLPEANAPIGDVFWDSSKFFSAGAGDDQIFNGASDDLGRVDKVDFQISGRMIQDCLLGGSFGSRQPDGYGMADH